MIISETATLSDNINDNIIVLGQLDLYGRIIGDVNVEKNAICNVYGSIVGTLTANFESQVVINGTVNGKIYN
jgi:cytoskeletal protein CcmA (bactofilin family)